MIYIKITPEINKLVAGLKEGIQQGIRSGMANLVADIEARAVKAAPVKSSNLVNSITRYITDGGMKGVIKATAKYAEFVHEGTGLYGPRRQKIVPRTKKALYWPGARHPVKSVKGQKPNPFFKKAVAQINPQKVFEEGIRNYLSKLKA